MIITLPVGIMQSNCYVVYDKESSQGYIIDPGGDSQPVLEVIENHQIKVQSILNTHGHFDHIAGNADLASLNVPYAIHPQDRDLLRKGGGAAWFGMAYSPPPEAAIDLSDGDILNAGKLQLHVIHTPGHTPGSVCFYIPGEKALISGDTLFAGSVGRADLPGGNAHVLMESLQRLLDLPAETVVYPGHGPATTLERERQNNPWIRQLNS